MSPRWFDKRTGDHLALDTGGGALARLWATALANKVDTPYVKATGIERADQPAADAEHAASRRSSGRSRSGPTRSSATARGSTSSPTRRHGAALPRPRVRRGARGPHEGLRGLRRPRRGDRLRLPRGGARRALAPPGHPRRQDRQLPPVPADAVERQPDGLLRHARAVRGRGDGPADLRGERAGRLPRHRHHARGPQLRPVPAVRRAHVPRRAARRSERVHSPMFGEQHGG